MLDRSQIFRSAWVGYQAQVADAAEARARLGMPPRGGFSRRLFASYLTSEWRKAKGRAALEARVAAEPTFTPAVAALRNELRVMELSDAPTNWDRHREVSIELFRLSAMEAPGKHA